MTTLSDELDLTRGQRWRNRLMLAPLTNVQSEPDGTLSEAETEWLLARARGGFALVCTAAAYVTPAGKAWSGQLGVDGDDTLPGLERLAAGVRSAGAVSAVQLHHGGKRADDTVSGHPRVSAYTDEAKGARQLTTVEVGAVVEDFAAAAARAERAGFDGVEVHGAHGYLLCQFLDPVRNLRDDGYGGTYEGRVRIVHEVIGAIRAATGPDFQVGLRLSPERHGVVLEEMVRLAGEVMADGSLDYLDLSMWDVRKRPHDADPADARLLIEHFTPIPRAGTRLAVAGAVAGAADAQWCIDRGAEVAVVGKGAIADHAFAERAVSDPAYAPPEFPLSRDQLRAELLSEPFVDYFATGWPHLVRD
jgi:2,4-dienoyl-CoA reductase-like NADH-dependent reductase (Old Yellow Enzyme family)